MNSMGYSIEGLSTSKSLLVVYSWSNTKTQRTD